METPRWIKRPTPNLGKRVMKPTLIVLHHSGGRLSGDIAWLTNRKSKVSADFEVARNGTIYKLNPQLREYVTWHAGISAWSNLSNCNRFSFGIEQEHREGQNWPDSQIRSTASLCAWLITQFPTLKLEKHCIQSHAAIAIPKGRKNDPENYPWDEFSRLVRGFLAEPS